MTDTAEQPERSQPNGLRRHFPTPYAIAGLRYTPMRDLIRGRVTSRLDWRGTIAAATDLPQSVRNLIERVVRRTRLWRIEKADVARELIAHFGDGLAAGTSVETLVRDFGEEGHAARLIRRAKRRNRSYVWHAKKWALRALAAVLALYVVGVVRFLLGHPDVKVDYIARLNEPTMRLAPADRAWPLYREAIIALGLPSRDGHRDTVLDEVAFSRPLRRKSWPAVAAWLDANQASIDLVRQGAARLGLGFVFGPNGDAHDDPALNVRYAIPSDPNSVEASTVSVLLPYLNYARQLAYILMADFDLAVQRGDAARAERDVVAALDLARHQEAPIVVCELVAIGIDAVVLDRLQRSVLEHAEVFDDATLTRLAHRVSQVAGGGQTASAILDISGERMMFDDILQRIYTDNGAGDGRLARESLTGLSMLNGIAGAKLETADLPAMLLASGVSLANSRQDNWTEYNRLMDRVSAAMGKPYREAGEATDRELDASIARLRSSPLLRAHYLPVLILTPSLNRAAATAERLLSVRDATATALALELYSRRHDHAYPATLDELVPTLLPALPVDRVTGGPLRYRVVDGKPVLYSIGTDLIDDGGVVPTRSGGPDNYAVALAGGGPTPITLPATGGKGDWVLYGKPRVDADDEMERRMKANDEDLPEQAATTLPTTEPATNP